jgi:hypothetical protein
MPADEGPRAEIGLRSGFTAISGIVASARKPAANSIATEIGLSFFAWTNQSRKQLTLKR